MAGATGLVGQAVLARLLADKRYTAVHCVGRRAPEQQDPRLVVHLTKFFKDFVAPPVDEVFIALGTTIKVAGSRAAFEAVDLDAVLTLARAGRAGGASRLGVVSAMGANPRSPLFYNRVKGVMEAAISGLGYTTVVIARPALLTGDRTALKQSQRAGEQWAARAFKCLSPLLPANYRPIAAQQVALALVDTLQSARAGRHLLLSADMAQHQATSPCA
ncbi:hypothetical protein SAMN05216344_11965 [Polaromonas sp. OV174]|nr:hypothetical protein SAMN05216344_11965 [Polaromonas sp. OV174]